MHCRVVSYFTCQHQHTHNAVELSLIDFKNELDVMESPWYLFGCALGIETKVLDRIEYRDDLGRYMTAMLDRWLKTGEATWEKLQETLIKIGNQRLAQGLEGHKTGQQGQSV